MNKELLIADFLQQREIIASNEYNLSAIVNPFRSQEIRQWCENHAEWCYLYAGTPPPDLVKLIPRFIPYETQQLLQEIVYTLSKKPFFGYFL